jgi:multicomponent Na+:H+ antiporter subunit D
MRAAMILFALACVLIGCFPQMLYALLPYPVDYQPYTGAHLVSQFQLLLFAGLAFFVMLPAMRRTLTISLDTDWLYRRMVPAIAGWLERIWTALTSWIQHQWQQHGQSRLHALIRWSLPGGALARTSPAGSMTLWVTVILVLVVVLAQRG